MRDQLAKVIQERVGLDEATAQQAAGVAIDFIKAQRPPELAPMLEHSSRGLMAATVARVSEPAGNVGWRDGGEGGPGGGTEVVVGASFGSYGGPA